MNYNIIILFIFSLLVCRHPLSDAIEFDFCVGDPTLPKSPNGYACKDPAKVTIDDFVYTGFHDEGIPLTKFKSRVTLVYADTFPALNGLSISKARAQIDVGGAMHRTSEIFDVRKGSVIAGFIDTNNTAYYKRLKSGDVMVIPPAMIHFVVNVGTTPATLHATYNGEKPGFNVINTALFASNIPADILAQTTLLSHDEVMRMKRLLFDGSVSSYFCYQFIFM